MPAKRRKLPAWRVHVWDLCHHPWFGHVATGLILVNTIIFAMQYAHQPDDYTRVLDIINYGEGQHQSTSLVQNLLWPSNGTVGCCVLLWLPFHLCTAHIT